MSSTRYGEEPSIVNPEKERTLIISGNGDVLEPDEGVAAIGSGGSYARAAATALVRQSDLDAEACVLEAMKVAGDICIYTNDQVSVEVLASS